MPSGGRTEYLNQALSKVNYDLIWNTVFSKMLQQLEDLEPFQIHCVSLGPPATSQELPGPIHAPGCTLHRWEALVIIGQGRKINSVTLQMGNFKTKHDETVKKNWVCTLIEDPSCKACKQCPSSDLAGQAMLHDLIPYKTWHVLVRRESSVDSLFGCAAHIH